MRITKILNFESELSEVKWMAKVTRFEKRPQGVRRMMMKITKFLIKPPLVLTTLRNEVMRPSYVWE